MAFNMSNKVLAIVQFDVVKETIYIINQNKEFLSGLLKKQLREGVDGFGRPVTVRGRASYRPLTIHNKLLNGVGLGRRIDIITNFMTGAFYSGIRPLTDGKKLTFKSDVVYFEEIISQSGGAIMKLNDDNLEFFKKTVLLPELDKRLKQRNGGI